MGIIRYFSTVSDGVMKVTFRINLQCLPIYKQI